MQTMNNNVVYWYRNQVVITYYTSKRYATSQEVLTDVHSFQDSINKQILNKTPYKLQTPAQNSMPASQHTMAESVSDNPGNLNGIYVIPGERTGVTSQLPPDTLAVFYTIETDQPENTMHNINGTMSSDGRGDHTLTVIKHLHTHQQVDEVGFNAMPHWFWTGTDDETHGCPVSPPIPVTDQGTPGQWKMQFQQLANSSLQEKTGAGVTVFVLDTLPSAAQLTQATTTSKNNTLLRKMIAGMKNSAPLDAPAPAININYLDVPGPDQTARTGKDIYGRLVGFPMADHGLTIAGIVRDLAPEAHIECIRVLNDYGVGDMNTLSQALQYIQGRLDHRFGPGDLDGKPVVINLSLVVVPPMADWGRFGWDTHPEELERILKGLASFMQSMAQDDVIFVASAGNDSDPRDYMMNPSEVRFGPRYPAAFLYEKPGVSTMIPVGAVNQQGKATTYSNHPGPDGFGAYGGELPRPEPWIPSAMGHEKAHIDPNAPMDAICGVFSDQYYPALSKNDRTEVLAPDTGYPVYAAPAGAWAYWVGTSFAVPIISALAARVLQGQARKSNASEGIDVRAAIRNAAQPMKWTGLVFQADADGSMIMVSQQWIADSTS